MLRRMRCESGGILIEALVAFAVLSVFISGMAAVLVFLHQEEAVSAEMSQASQIASQQFSVWTSGASVSSSVPCLVSFQSTTPVTCSVNGVTYTNTAWVSSGASGASVPAQETITWKSPFGSTDTFTWQTHVLLP